MTSTSSPPAVQRPRPSSRTGGGLPTLFRIPKIGDSPQTGEPVAEPEAATTADASDGKPPTTPTCESADAPEPRYERIDPRHSYNKLPELPPIIQPEGRSWIETIGSRLVLILLFAAVALVAILATRDVPSTAESNFLAEDTRQQNTPVHVAEADLSVDRERSGFGEIPPPVDGPSFPAAATASDLLVGESSADVPNPQPSHDDALPSFDEIDDGPVDLMPAFPKPDLALHPADAKQNPDARTADGEVDSAHDDADDSEPVDKELADTGPGANESNLSITAAGNGAAAAKLNEGETEAISESSQEKETSIRNASMEPLADDVAETRVANLNRIAEAESPVYRPTSTPDAIEDWGQFVQTNPSNQGPFAVGETEQPPGRQPAAGNQFNYPAAPPSGSPMNEGQSPPYAAYPNQYQPNQYQPNQYQPNQYQPNYAPQQQAPVYVPGQGYGNQQPAPPPTQQQQPAEYVPGAMMPPNNYGRPAGEFYPQQTQPPANGYGYPNPAPYVGQQPYVPNR